MTNKQISRFALLAGILVAVLMTACGEDVLVIEDNHAAFTMVESMSGSECNAAAEGSMVFVKSTSRVFICSDGEWATINDYEVDSPHCESLPLDDSSGYAIVCDGDTIGVTHNGEKGADGNDGKDGIDGKDGDDGDDGDNGKDGTACTVMNLDDGSGYNIYCSDSLIGTVTNGRDGESIKGATGDSCSSKTLDNGDLEITCGGKYVGTLAKGSKGAPGTAGSRCEEKERDDGRGYDLYCGDALIGTLWNGEAGSSIKGTMGDGCESRLLSNGDIEIFCGEQSVGVLAKGQNGMGCSFEDDGHGLVKLTCADKAEETYLYKAVCGDKPYDPATHACTMNNIIWPLCGAVPYDSVTHVCSADNIILSFCGSTTYDSTTHYCYDEIIYEQSLCGTKKYVPTSHFCDERDGQIYRFVQVDAGEDYSDAWMAQNLNYRYLGKMNNLDSGSFCYNNDDVNCDVYGRLYTTAAALDSLGIEDPNGLGVGCGYGSTSACVIKTTMARISVKGICPEGWRLPEHKDFDDLYNALAAQRGLRVRQVDLNDYGFSILLGGWFEYRSNSLKFNAMGSTTRYTSFVHEDGSGYNYYSTVYINEGSDHSYCSGSCGWGYVRCIKDKP